MKGMILAAGKGTRLGPLTDQIPKALVPIAGKPALGWLIERLGRLGFTDLIINSHHLGEQIEAFLLQQRFASTHVSLSPEKVLLDTGGGLLQTKSFWNEESFILHNADIVCNFNLIQAYQLHQQEHRLVTLLVQNRVTKRKLVFDDRWQLCGLDTAIPPHRPLLRIPEGRTRSMGFSGIHILSPKLFSLITETGYFPILDCYLRLVQEGHVLHGFDIGNAYWKDFGTPEQLALLEQDCAHNPQLLL